MKFTFTLYFTLINILAFAQTIVPKTIGALPATANESSGLIYFNNQLFTHNDGDNGPFIYQLDTNSAAILRSIFVANAPNTDWEDLAQDANYLYIADVGNNQGNRTNLRIFRIAKSSILLADTVLADTIKISYANQTNFANSTFTTNFDAEALVATTDFLYIFSKQWGKPTTRVYQFPKTPGSYSAMPLDSLVVQGFVTGADFDATTSTLCLLGNFGTNPYVIQIKNFTWPNFSTGTKSTHQLNQAGSPQVEGICFGTNNQIYFSSEQLGSTNALLTKGYVGPDLSTSENDFANQTYLYPNPTTDGVTVKIAPQYFGANIHLVDMYGRQIGQLNNVQSETILVALPNIAGIYFVQFYFCGVLQHQQRVEKF